MTHERFVMRSLMPASAEAVLDWHSRPGAFERLTPPWENVRVLERTGGITDGGRLVLAVRAGGRWRRWVATHCDFEPGRQFCDVQTEGPFAQWRHCHRFLPDGPDRCFLEDDISYALPFGRLGKLIGGSLVRRQLQQMFDYRHRVTASDLSLHLQYQGGRSMKVAITGSTGLVGSALVPLLSTGGHNVVRLVRSADGSRAGEVAWDPATGRIDADGLEGLDGVVHLAGENIAARRWNAEQKARIRDSRVQGTTLLCETLAKLRQPPRVLISASAIGFYGNRGDEPLHEASGNGGGFLPEVCREWEAATQPAAKAGIRVVHLRFGIILSPRGGALAKMLTPFRLGLGGRIGSGQQWMSWIALDDVVGSIYHALATESLRGPVNVVAPRPVQNREFTRTLGRVLWRPTLFPMPGFMARLAFGEMADELLLASARVSPQALLDSGYWFLYSDLESALRHLLGKDQTKPPVNEPGAVEHAAANHK
ncbi:MAG: TIGR01777 family protein [Planctomycetes bacterium]|nr:TIGR01777 family protein [Planctomycetota bacterium]